ncbi:MAG: putative glycosyltransferase [Frankiales bacterium]|nr:putative glycosyltransferase [Frankiales bacterium]
MTVPQTGGRPCVVLLDVDGTASWAGADVVVRPASLSAGGPAFPDGAPGGAQLQRALDAGRGNVVVVTTAPVDRGDLARRFGGDAARFETGVVAPRGTLVTDPSASWEDALAAFPSLPALAPGERFLVLVDRVPDVEPRWDRPEAELLRALVALWPEVPIVLVSSEPALGAAAAWRELGVEVVADCPDWDPWFLAHRLTFSTVFSLGIRTEHRFSPFVDRHLPSAVRVLLAHTFDSRRVLSLEPALVVRDEVRGLHGLGGLLRERVATSLERADLVLCSTQDDRRQVEGLFPTKPVVVLPDPLAGSTSAAPLLSDLVVLASPGADTIASHEDAAVAAARSVLPVLRATRPDTTLRVLADNPSPLVVLLGREPGVVVEPLGPDPVAAIASSQVCLAPYSHGDGARAALSLAAAAGTPLLVLPHAATSLDLGETWPAVVCNDTTAMALRARDLLENPGQWDQARAAMAAKHDAGGRAAYRRAVVNALAGCGVAPPTSPFLLPDGELRAVGSRPAPPPPPMLPIPEGLRQNMVIAAKRNPLTSDEQYTVWRSLHEPTAERLSALRERVAALEDPPLISILVPIYNSAPAVLGDTISSVLDQVYPHWELCLADDCSPSQETRDALQEWAARDSRIRLVLLAVNEGISGATNAALAHARGSFVALLDHDDLLKPHALAEVALALAADPSLDLVYTDEDKMDENGDLVQPFFKPAWSPEHLTSRNYVTHLTVARTSMVSSLGGLRSGFDGSQDHDLVLRLSEQTERVHHIAEPLYTWRLVPGSTAAVVDAKPYAFDASKNALDEALVRRGYTGKAVDGILASTYRLKYDVIGRPKVTIIIPTRNGEHLMRRAIDSVRDKSTYPNYEFLVVDNESDDPGTLAYLATFGGRVLRYPHRFNYARMMNVAAWAADGDMLLFLNNDTEVIAPDWIESMLEHAQRPEVGAVGCRLYYPDDRPQHEAVIVNYSAGAAGNVDHQGWWGFGEVVRDVTAVTGAVTMMRPSVFHEVGGFEERLRVAFNDVDLCLRVRQAGYRVVYTPFATLYHHESATRGVKPHLEDDAFFDDRWEPRSELFHDPFYNVNLDRSRPFAISGERRT